VSAFPAGYVRRTDEPTPLEKLYRVLLPMAHAHAKTRLRRRCGLVVEHFMRGRSHESLAICLGVGVDLIEDALRWYMNHPPKKRRKVKWSRARLLAAVRNAKTQLHAARLMQGSAGAIRKRCLRDAELKRLWLALGRRMSR
jgi:hypothetical protein